jgi:hypothetical protein
MFLGKKGRSFILISCQLKCRRELSQEKELFWVRLSLEGFENIGLQSAVFCASGGFSGR